MSVHILHTSLFLSLPSSFAYPPAILSSVVCPQVRYAARGAVDEAQTRGSCVLVRGISAQGLAGRPVEQAVLHLAQGRHGLLQAEEGFRESEVCAVCCMLRAACVLSSMQSVISSYWIDVHIFSFLAVLHPSTAPIIGARPFVMPLCCTLIANSLCLWVWVEVRPCLVHGLSRVFGYLFHCI